jgi:hypothetical protein
MLRQLLEVKWALPSTIISDMWDQWRQSTSDATVEVKHLILDDHFSVNIKFVMEFLEQLFDMLCYVNTENPCLSEIYNNMNLCVRGYNPSQIGEIPDYGHN